ncbi:MAG: hypothetical protein WC532_02420 [Candidatus Omnitrophota bacterium]
MINRLFPATPETKETFRKFAEQVTGWHVKDTHIKCIKIHAFSDRIKRPVDSNVSVGEELDANLSNSPHEPVLAIFESEDVKEYLVVTPNRNSQKGTLYFFDPQEVIGIEKEDN